jgi:hypothetical protein
MKTLRKQHQELENNIRKRFEELIKGKEYDIVNNIIEREYQGTEQEQLKAWVKDENYIECFDFSLEEMLPQIYFNNRRGEEIRCYLLSVSDKNGLYIFTDEDTNPFFISFSDLNELYSKIDVIEAIESI